MKESLNRIRYSRIGSGILYPLSRALHAPAGFLQREIPRRIRRNGGTAVYDGVPLSFPVGVGADFLSLISWHGTKGFEPDTWRELRRLIEGSGTFLDIGANIGLYSVLAAKVKPGIHVVSFEPVPGIHADCVRFHEANRLSGAEVLQLALSDADGEATIYEPLHDHTVGQSSASTLASDSWQARKSPRTTVVKTARLDSLLASRTLAGPVAMKIDVEGFEPAVLRGAAETIAKYRPRIVCEILPRPDGNSATVREIQALGYVPYAITSEGCFRMSFDDFSAPRSFTDFLLLPAAEAGANFLPVQ